jgi:hypothetical protein
MANNSKRWTHRIRLDRSAEALDWKFLVRLILHECELVHRVDASVLGGLSALLTRVLQHPIPQVFHHSVLVHHGSCDPEVIYGFS